MSAFVSFLIGFLFGGTFGIGIMAIIVAANSEEIRKIAEGYDKMAQAKRKRSEGD